MNRARTTIRLSSNNTNSNKTNSNNANNSRTTTTFQKPVNVDVKSHYEKPNAHTLVVYIKPAATYVAKCNRTFLRLAKEHKVNCETVDQYFINAKKHKPFYSHVTFKIKTHPTKGYLVVFKNKLKDRIPLRGYSECSLGQHKAQFQFCNEWWTCRYHCKVGYLNYHAKFRNQLADALVAAGVTHIPKDKSPLCLDAVCLRMNSSHSGIAGVNQKRNYYIDISDSSIKRNKNKKIIMINIESNRKITALCRCNEIPNRLFYDTKAAVQEIPEKKKYVASISMAYATLKPGRYFISVWGGVLFKESTFSISIFAAKTKAEEDWTLLGDEDDFGEESINFGKKKLMALTSETSDSTSSSEDICVPPILSASSVFMPDSSFHVPSLADPFYVLPFSFEKLVNQDDLINVDQDIDDLVDDDDDDEEEAFSFDRPPLRSLIPDTNVNKQGKKKDHFEELNLEEIDALEDEFELIDSTEATRPVTITEELRTKPTISDCIGDADTEKCVAECLSAISIQNNNNSSVTQSVIQASTTTAMATSSSIHISSMEPNYFVCPISHQIMKEPVVAADGYSYELEAIQRWFKFNNTSPVTGKVLQHQLLTVNFNLKLQIKQWHETVTLSKSTTTTTTTSSTTPK